MLSHEGQSLGDIRTNEWEFRNDRSRRFSARVAIDHSELHVSTLERGCLGVLKVLCKFAGKKACQKVGHTTEKIVSALKHFDAHP
jgi:hypothetical protein